MKEQDAKAPVAPLKNSKVPTAYLSQQLSQLQDKVGAISLNGTRGWTLPVNTNVDEHEFPPLGVEARPKRDQSREPVREDAVQIASARIDDSGAESFDVEDRGYVSGQGRRRGRWPGEQGRERRNRRGAEQDESSADEDACERDWRVVVLDTSALLWAPQGVRGLVRQGLEVIVPAEALRTLDLLKSGSSPSARAARSAARWIEHSSKHYKAAKGQHKHGRGLRIQQDSETSPPDSISSLPIPVIDGDVLPKWMEAILGCAAFFIASANGDGSDAASIASISESGPTLCVANPPLTVEVEEGFTGNIGQRGEGYLISQEAERYEIPIEVLRDDEEDMDEPKRKAPQRGKGKNGVRGRGGGGRNGQRVKEDSPEREVKILLRRPEPEDAAASASIPAPQLSSPSSAHRSPLPEPPRVEPPRPPLPPAFVPRGPSSPRAPAKHPHPQPPPSPRGTLGPNPPSGRPGQSGMNVPARPPHVAEREDVPPPRDSSQRRPTQELYNPRGARDRAEHDEKPGRGRGGGRGGRGQAGRRGGRGGPGGRGGGNGGSGHGPVSGEFVLLQRPGPPPVEERMGGGSSGPKVVLLQRPK